MEVSRDFVEALVGSVYESMSSELLLRVLQEQDNCIYAFNMNTKQERVDILVGRFMRTKAELIDTLVERFMVRLSSWLAKG